MKKRRGAKPKDRTVYYSLLECLLDTEQATRHPSLHPHRVTVSSAIYYTHACTPNDALAVVHRFVGNNAERVDQQEIIVTLTQKVQEK